MQGIVNTYILIFLTGMLGIWKAVPVGVAVGADPLGIWLMTTLGATAAVITLYFFGNRIRAYLERKRQGRSKGRKDKRAAQLFEKYGTPGLGLLGCLLMGPNMTMLIGLVIVKSPIKLLYWTIGGIVIWSLALTMLAILSVDLFYRLTSLFN